MSAWDYLVAQQSIVRFTLVDGDNKPVYSESLTIKDMGPEGDKKLIQSFDFKKFRPVRVKPEGL